MSSQNRPASKSASLGTFLGCSARGEREKEEEGGRGGGTEGHSTVVVCLGAYPATVLATAALLGLKLPDPLLAVEPLLVEWFEKHSRSEP